MLQYENKTIKRLRLERDDCPVCNSDQHEVIYKGKRKHPEARYFKRLKCLVCDYEYIAESEKEFNERVNDFIK